MPPKTKQCQDNGKPSRKGCGGPKSYKEKAKNDPKQKKVSEMFRPKVSESEHSENKSNQDQRKQDTVHTELREPLTG